MPKISLIIPCYKVEKWLPDCLNSILSQSFDDWEAICVDDGSPDNCGKMLDEYAKKDSRIKVIHQQNQGLSMARNAAYSIISAPFVMFVDSDDCLHPQALEFAYKAITSTKTDMVWFDYEEFDDGESIETKMFEFGKVSVFNRPLSRYMKKHFSLFNRKARIKVMVWDKIYKTELVLKVPFTEKVSPGEDNLFTTEMFTKYEKVAHLPYKLYFYRMRKDSIMNSLREQREWKIWLPLISKYVNLQEKLQGYEQIKVIKWFVAERVFCKKILCRYIRKPEAAPAEVKKIIDELLVNNKLDFSVMGIKYRLGVWCYRHNMIKMCRFFIG